jgi:hypothetical protein
MFAFIDESGHTGKKISDSSQSNFYSLGLLSRYNPDVFLKSGIETICSTNHITELHGAELGPKIENIAGPLLSLLKIISPKFFLAEVDKDYLALTKVFDTLFDNVENPGVRHHTYQIRPFRILLLYKLAAVVEKSVAFKFYEDCLFASSEEKAMETLIETCDKILEQVHILPDARSRELITDALTWAKDHPIAITAFNTRKIDRWRHLPNVVTFLPMLNMFSKYSKKYNSKVNKIIHDEQNQVKEIFKEIHALASRKDGVERLDLRENGYILLKNLRESVFEMKSSDSSPGLQIVDICLYVFCHRDFILRNHQENPYTFNLLTYIIDSGSYFDFTLDGFIKESNELYEKIMSLPLTEEEIENGEKILEDMETNWKVKLAESK